MQNEFERKFISAILKKIKENEKRVFRIAKGRVENQETLIELGLTDSNIEQIILDLEVNDCVKSFKQDKAGLPGYVFEFGKEIKGKEIYIKFRVLFENDVCYVNCISFHYAKYKLKYLFK